MVAKCKNGGGYFLRNTNKKKGFTLIELLAVIVILAVIALIATPIILNIVNDARKSAAKDSTLGYIEAIENKVALSSLENKTYEDKEGYVYDEIEANVKGKRPTGGLYTLKKGIVTNGTFCVDGFIVNYENNKAEVGNKGCNEESLKLNGSIKLSSNSGNYTYPETKEIEVIENISGGKLSCTTSDSDVATCTISGKIITVKSGTKEGSATLTITSSSTSKYNEAKAAYVASTTPGLLSVTANGYNGIYDSNSHGITVKVENAIIKYGEEEGTYNLEESPKYSNVGEYTVYYEITKAGYETVTGKKNVVITKAEGKIVLEASKGTVAYKEIKEVEIVENVSNGEIEVEIANPSVLEVSVKNNKIVIKGKEIGATTLTVTSKETHNYNSKSTQYNIEVTKANNTLKLSSTSGNYTYPESKEVEVIENTSGGSLSCTTSNSKVATCSISGNIITVTPGTTVGTANITITSAATTNYNSATVTHIATTEEGLLSVTATGYSGTYDGAAHGITVTASGATIKYGTKEGNYTSTSSPTYKDARIYNVYYQVTKPGYKTVTGSKQVIIIPSVPTITASDSKTSGQWHNGNYTLSFNVLGDSSSVYYYYGITENPSTRGSSISINTETASTTYYVKACITDTLCSTNSSYISKVDKTTPALSLRDSADNTDSSLIYSSSFGISGGTTTCINQSNNNLNVSTPNSVGILGSNVIKCTATSNSGLTTTITKKFVLYGHFKYGSGLQATNGAYASGTSIVVPPGTIQYGPYIPIHAGCYQVWYNGNNLNGSKEMYKAYSGAGASPSYSLINLNYVSSNANYFLQLNSFSSDLETTIYNNSSATVTVDEIYIWYKGSSC